MSTELLANTKNHFKASYMIPQATAGRTLYSSFDDYENVKRLKKHLAEDNKAEEH